MLDEDHYGLQDIKDRILVRTCKLMLHAYMYKLKLQVKHFSTLNLIHFLCTCIGSVGYSVMVLLKKIICKLMSIKNS